MEESHSHSHNASSHVTDECGAAAGGSTIGAKYRLMPPSKLPISRSTSITIPPGLSPTSFLESPVLLSNIKAEPSPTTGSFFKRQLMQGSGQNAAALCLERICSNSNSVDERSSSSFEFKFQTGASSTSTGLGIPVGLNRNEPVIDQDHRYSQSPTPLSLASQSLAVSMHDSSVCSTGGESNLGGQCNTGMHASSSDKKSSISSVSAERTSDDEYNWRKYGQKLVKGSEFPRSYYKCTYPNCEVKKIFERSPSGQITEIVYKGSHDHPKPQAARRHNPGSLMTIQEDKLDKDLLFTDKSNTNNMEPNVSPVLSPLQANEDGLDGSGLQLQGINDDIDEDDPYLKRRKVEDGIDVTPVVKPIREPRVVVQTMSEVDILDDGYKWRKYGQKVVRGNPNPRSYYKCTNPGCPVRKHVERASHDPKAVITTYEGKHNHDVPIGKNNSHEFAGTAPPYIGSLSIRPDESSSSISLDLGVGIGRVSETRSNDHLHTVGQRQIVPNNSNMMVVQASQISACYGVVNGDLNRVEGRSFQTPSILPPNQYPQNLERILMGRPQNDKIVTKY